MTAVFLFALLLYLPKTILRKNNMHDLIYKIISYTQAKYRCTYNKWYIGLTDNPKETRKEFESKNMQKEKIKMFLSPTTQRLPLLTV